MEPHIEALVEMSVGQLDIPFEQYPKPTQTRVRNIIRSLLKKSTTRDEAKAQMMSCIGSIIPVERVLEIMDLPDEPIPIDQNTMEHLSRQKSRPWTTYENQRLLAGIYKFGLDSWSPIASFVGNGRTRSQCSQRWVRGLNPKISKSAWTSEEELRLIDLVNTYGDKSWTKISSELGHRSDVQCRYKYQQLKRENIQKSTNYGQLSPQQYKQMSTQQMNSMISTYQPSKKHQKEMKRVPKKTNIQYPKYYQQNYAPQMPTMPMMDPTFGMFMQPTMMYNDPPKIEPSGSSSNINTQIFMPETTAISEAVKEEEPLASPVKEESTTEETPQEETPMSFSALQNEQCEFQIFLPQVDASWFAVV